MAESSLILVTGATGAVGPQVVKSLDEAGYQIRTLSLDPPPAGMSSERIEAKLGDVTNPVDVQSAMRGVDAVVHLAALLHIVNPPADLRQKYEKVNVGGTATVVEAALTAGVRRVVLFSTIAVYGNSSSHILTEETPVKPDTFYGQTKLLAEKIVLNSKREDGQPLGTVLRFGAIYGPRIRGNYQWLIKALNGRRFVPIGDGRNRRTLIYDRDVAKAALLAVEHPKAAGKVYNVSDGDFHPLKEIIVVICKALGQKPLRLSVPVGPVRLAAGILEDVGRMIGVKSPIVRATIDKYTEDIAVDSQRIQTELGFRPQFDLLTGWQETVQEMRRVGDL